VSARFEGSGFGRGLSIFFDAALRGIEPSRRGDWRWRARAMATIRTDFAPPGGQRGEGTVLRSARRTRCPLCFTSADHQERQTAVINAASSPPSGNFCAAKASVSA
jgi:hypothetical protein